ncbi:MAG: TolC family protein [Nitrospiraceae bacterium]|nr:TolC family protein [Nitrospiraceae bacterium]MDA8090808.1 TolC family protein [Nitrospiraceae bacterium]
MRGHLFRLTVPVIFISLIAGCASFHAKPISPSGTARAFEARTLASRGLREFMEKNENENEKIRHRIKPWPPASWDFSMLALAAAYYSPSLDVMRAKWGMAQAAVITAGGRPNPSASFFGEHHSSTPGGISPWTWGISFSIPIETAGKRGYRIRKAKHLSAAAQLNIDETAWQVWSRLKKSLLDLYAAAGRQLYLRGQLSAQEKIAQMFEQRLSAGESSQFEVTQSRLALDKMRLALADNQKKKVHARGELAMALGLQAKALDGIRISFNLFKRPPRAIALKDIRRKALLGRADVLAALQEYEASQSALQFEIAKQYPDVHIGPGYEWDQGDNRWSLGFSLVLPVLNQNQGPIAEARARRKELAAKFSALQSGIIGQIDSAGATYAQSLKNLQVAGSIVSTEGGNMRAVRARFNSGEAGRLDLEQAKMEFLSAELSRLDAFVLAQADLIELEDAVQRPLVRQEWPIDEREVLTNGAMPFAGPGKTKRKDTGVKK